jgi:hypothetical protein
MNAYTRMIRKIEKLSFRKKVIISVINIGVTIPLLQLGIDHWFPLALISAVIFIIVTNITWWGRDWFWAP